MTPEPSLAGISLSLYVAVSAALAEGFELERVLAHEGLAPDHWEQAERAWALALAAEDPTLLDVFDRAFQERQARFRRALSPLDEDLDAWVAFLRHWLAAEDPARVLLGLGLGVTDAHRLQRAWGSRLADDAALRERFGELLQEALGPLPEVRAAPLQLLEPVGANGVSTGEKALGARASAPSAAAEFPLEAATTSDAPLAHPSLLSALP